MRILSRDKVGLNEILTKDMIDTMVRLAGLVCDEEAVNVTNQQSEVKGNFVEDL